MRRAPGGAVRSAELIEPGYVHDLCSAFYPLAARSRALLDLRTFRFAQFTISLSLMLVMMASLFGVIILLPLFMLGLIVYGLAQYLVLKKWTRWFLVTGQNEGDALFTDALRRFMLQVLTGV